MRAVLFLLLCLPLLAPPGVCACRWTPTPSQASKRPTCSCPGCLKKHNRAQPPAQDRAPCCPAAEERPYTPAEPPDLPALHTSAPLPAAEADTVEPFRPAPPPATPPHPPRPPILRC